MESVRHDIAYDLLLKKTKLPSKPIDAEGEINSITQHINYIYFVIPVIGVHHISALITQMSLVVMFAVQLIPNLYR